MSDKKTYKVSMECYNCGNEFLLEKKFGDKVGSDRFSYPDICPNCGCDTIRRKVSP